jgi:hypothetical protein
MSNWTTTENKIALKDREILVECINEVAKERNQQVVTTSRGINVKGLGWYELKEDQYRLSYDTDVRSRAETFHEHVQARYQAKGAYKVLANYGYTTRSMQADKDRARVLVRGLKL